MKFNWKSFNYQTNDIPTWNASDVSLIRFKNCIFTSGTQQIDVTSVLNSMSNAYKGGNLLSLSLDRPLNPYSFVIMGYNDSNTIKYPTTQLVNVPTTLTGYWKVI